MKKLLLSITTVLAVGFVNAQIHASLDSTDFAAWTTIDVDNDGNNWTPVVINNATITAPGFDGTDGYLSNSFDGVAQAPLTPDNIGISPAIDCSGDANVFLTWSCGSPESTASGWHDEHYAVYAVLASDLPGLSTGTYPTPVFETTLTSGETFFTEEVDISAIAGNQSGVHIVLRHFDCTDNNWLLVDYVKVQSTSIATIEEADEVAFVTAFPNPTNDVLNINSDVETKNVSILNLDGKVISSKKVNGMTAQIEVSSLKSGLYFYEVETVNGVLRNTFVKK